MNKDRIYLMEVYRHIENKKNQVRVHCGTFEQNRDGLSCCMISTREFYAPNKKIANKKVRLLIKELNKPKSEKNQYRFVS